MVRTLIALALITISVPAYAIDQCLSWQVDQIGNGAEYITALPQLQDPPEPDPQALKRCANAGNPQGIEPGAWGGFCYVVGTGPSCLNTRLKTNIHLANYPPGGDCYDLVGSRIAALDGKCPIGCPAGKHLNPCSGYCVNNGECPPGTHSTVHGGFETCTPDCEPCPDGYIRRNDGSCSTTCPPGQHADNGYCTPDATSCPDGQHIENGACVPDPECPSGQHYEDGDCEPDNPANGQGKIGEFTFTYSGTGSSLGHVLPNGYNNLLYCATLNGSANGHMSIIVNNQAVIYNGDSTIDCTCTSGVTTLFPEAPSYTTCACPTGYYQGATGCLQNTCPEGQHFNEQDQCVPDDPGGGSCTAPQVQGPDGQCHDPGQNGGCPAGQVLNTSGQCVTPPTCTPPQVAGPDGQCHNPGQNGGCPAGKVLDATGQCVDPPSCPAGKVRGPDGQCYTPGTSGGCPAGKILNSNGQCVDDPSSGCPVGQGPCWPGA